MSREKNIKWLYAELPVLTENKILSSESALRLKEYYGPEPQKAGPGLAFIITSVLGSLLIGAGIILLFAHNWEELSRSTRAVFSVLPLIVAQLLYVYVFFKKKDSVAWVESSGAFLMLMLASSIALISQTYNLGGTLKDFIFTCMLLSIPLMYLTNASLVCMFYLIGITYWSVEASVIESYQYLALLVVAIPHLWLNIRSEATTIRGNILGWTLSVSLFVSCFSLMEGLASQYLIYAHALVFVLLYLIGKIAFKNGAAIWSRPFQTMALLVITFYSLSLSYEWYLRYFNNSYGKVSILYYSVLGAAILLSILLLLIYNLKKYKDVNYFVIAYPLILFLGNIIYNYGEMNLPVVIFNVYVLSFGIYYIILGVKTGQIAFVNAGMFFTSVLLVERFFDRDISFIAKGIIFIIIGISFLLVNLILMKKRKVKDAKALH